MLLAARGFVRFRSGNKETPHTRSLARPSGKQSLNAEHDSAGALRAIAEMHPLAKPQVLGYRYIDDSTLDEAQRRYYEANGDARKVFRVLNDEQVAAEVWGSIAKISENIQVIFPRQDRSVVFESRRVCDAFSGHL